MENFESTYFACKNYYYFFLSPLVVTKRCANPSLHRKTKPNQFRLFELDQIMFDPVFKSMDRGTEKINQSKPVRSKSKLITKN